MQQKQLTLLKRLLMAVLVLGIGFGCKKSGTNNTPTPIDPLQNFVLIPTTNIPFVIGSPDGTNGTTKEVGRSTDEQAHKVNLSSFYMSKYELTIGEFKAFLASKDTIYLPAGQRSMTNYYNTGWGETDKHPMTNVSWNAAVRCCNFRSKQAGLDTCYTFKVDGSINNCDFAKKGYRLPTEAEWEYACRGNTTGTPFASGTNITTAQANYDGNYPYNGNPKGTYLEKTVPVDIATYYKNAFGLEHMHGNVWEWCWDWYKSDYYPTDGSVQTNPTGPTTGSNRVIRGGSWSNHAVDLRSAYREYDAPGNWSVNIGFRLAKTL